MVATVKQVFPRHRDMLQSWRFRGTVPPAMPPRLKLTQELRPVGFRLPDENHIRVRLRLVWQQGYMGSTNTTGIPSRRNWSAMAYA
jgi:hypothetical protein